MSLIRTVRILPTLALGLMAAGLAQADTVSLSEGTITVTDDVTQVGPLFQYDYTVSDTTGQLAVLDIGVSPGVAISGLTGPGGSADFQTAYDSVLGLVSFIANGSAFSTSPLSGFIFDSPTPPGASTFGVTLFDGATGGGNVEGPVGPVVPEPSSLPLCVLGGAALLFWRKRSWASPV
jgi:hypothetical protein